MADVFESHIALDDQRTRLWDLITNTPNLDWLLLTKRPHNIRRMVPWKDVWPANVWVGTTIENQVMADKRLPHLLTCNAVIRFLSCEPLLGPLDLRTWFDNRSLYSIDWIIAGGESGGAARPMHPDWALSLLQQCQEFGVSFHFKQWGHWVPAELFPQIGRSEMLNFENERSVKVVRLSKKLAGRLLRGTTWDGVPKAHLTNA
jgi:protein gp37